MKILFNTRYNSNQNMMVRIYNETLTYFKHLGLQVFFNDWGNYKNYDIILFYTGESEISKIRSLNPNAKIGIIDPSPKNLKEAQTSDFLIVCAIEQRDFWLKYNKNIFINLAIPDIKRVSEKKRSSNVVKIGYHGNLVHLNCFYPSLTNVLDDLSDLYPIELHVIYNKDEFGKWIIGRPKRLKTIDIQWKEDIYETVFPDFDIGICPSYIPFKNSTVKFLDKFAYNSHRSDYLVKYKVSSGPGRLYPFLLNKIPVVADAIPSNCQVIQDSKSGFLVNSDYGWYYRLEELICSKIKRKQIGQEGLKALKSNLNHNKSKENLASDLINFLNNNKNKDNIKISRNDQNIIFLIIQVIISRVKKRIKLLFNV